MNSVDPIKWTEFAAHMDRLRGAEVRPVEAGAFRGYEGRVVRDGIGWRAWWLAAGTLGLNVLYSCDPASIGKDDAALDRMLSSLRLGAGETQ